MTISSDISSITHITNENVAIYPFNFKVYHKTEIKVVVSISNEQSLKLELGLDYTVEGLVQNSGGNIHLTENGLIKAKNGNKISIFRQMDFLQEVDYRPHDLFPAETHERALDKLTMQDQELKEQLSRAMLAPVGSDKSAADLWQEMFVNYESFVKLYNEIKNKNFVLFPATENKMGGIKVGETLKVAADGLLNIKVDLDTEINQALGIHNESLTVHESIIKTAINEHDENINAHKKAIDFKIIYPGGTEEEPGAISINQRIVTDNPFASASCIAEAEIFYKGYWGWSGHFTAVYSTAQHYFVEAKTLNETIVIQSATNGICVEGNRGGSPIPGLAQIMKPTPFRVKVWKIGELS